MNFPARGSAWWLLHANEFAANSDWFVMLFTSVVIGQRNLISFSLQPLVFFLIIPIFRMMALEESQATTKEHKKLSHYTYRYKRHYRMSFITGNFWTARESLDNVTLKMEKVYIDIRIWQSEISACVALKSWRKGALLWELMYFFLTPPSLLA